MNWKYPQPQFWFLVIGVTLAALHLSLIYRSSNNELFTTCLLIWFVVGSLLGDKQHIPKSSNSLFANAIGFSILGLLIFRCSHLPTSRMFLYILPFLGSLGLVMAVIGWKGLRFYRYEFLILFVLAINPVLEILLLAGNLSEMTAISASGLLQYLGFPTTQQGTFIHLFNKQVEVYSLCSGIHSILQMLNIAVLFVVMFLPRGGMKQVVCVGIGIILGFITNAIRVALMVILFVFSSQSAFDYWHDGRGSLIFSTIAVSLFGTICWFAFLRSTPLPSNAGVRTNG